jgi:phage host-nuclease inhibitor protein Gam
MTSCVQTSVSETVAGNIVKWRAERPTPVCLSEVFGCVTVLSHMHFAAVLRISTQMEGGRVISFQEGGEPCR